MQIFWHQIRALPLRRAFHFSPALNGFVRNMAGGIQQHGDFFLTAISVVGRFNASQQHLIYAAAFCTASVRGQVRRIKFEQHGRCRGVSEYAERLRGAGCLRGWSSGVGRGARGLAGRMRRVELVEMENAAFDGGPGS